MALVVTTRGGRASRPAPPFTLDDVRRPGTPVAYGPRLGKPAVVNFFAAWCVPCREELPHLEEAHRRAGEAVAFIGVDVSDSRRAAGELLDGLGITFPAGYDPDSRVAAAYRLRGMPTTAFIDANGRVVREVRGPLRPEELDRWVRRLERGRRVGIPSGDGRG